MYAEVECDTLTEPENGSIITGPRVVGSLAIYICDVGHTLSVPSPAYRQCQADKTWSGVEPTCDRKIAILSYCIHVAVLTVET